jgi:hypothetical protein
LEMPGLAAGVQPGAADADADAGAILSCPIHQPALPPAALCCAQWFARLWEIEADDFWGYITNCGTEGNLHGILVGREALPDGILYASRETHYSVFKAGRMYRMDAVKVGALRLPGRQRGGQPPSCNVRLPAAARAHVPHAPPTRRQVGTLDSGEIDYEELRGHLVANASRPAIINVNIGTTVKGAVDDIDRILDILKVGGAGSPGWVCGQPEGLASRHPCCCPSHPHSDHHLP